MRRRTIPMELFTEQKRNRMPEETKTVTKLKYISDSPIDSPAECRQMSWNGMQRHWQRFLVQGRYLCRSYTILSCALFVLNMFTDMNEPGPVWTANQKPRILVLYELPRLFCVVWFQFISICFHHADYRHSIERLSQYSPIRAEINWYISLQMTVEIVLFISFTVAVMASWRCGSSAKLWLSFSIFFDNWSAFRQVHGVFLTDGY